MRRWLPFALLIALAASGILLVLHRGPQGAPLPAAEVRTEAGGQNELSAADRSAAERSTRAVEPSSAAAPTGAQERPSAQLVVHVRRKLSHAPVEGSQIRVLSGRPATGLGSNAPQVAETFGKGQTDSAGQLGLSVPAGEPLVILAGIPGRTPSSESVDVGNGIAAGASFEIEILLPEENDTRVFGLVVDAATGQPLAGALVQLRDEYKEPRPGTSSTTARDGRFELACTSWARPHLRIEARGCGLRLADPAGHADPARPLIVRMAKSSTLRVLAHDPAGAPVAGARVELLAKGSVLGLAESEAAGFFMREYVSAPDESWSAATGADGRATIEGLPAGVELRGQLDAPGASRLRTLDPLTLAPGQTRELELLLGEGTRIVGTALDQLGQPIAAHEIRLAACERDPQQRTLLLENARIRARATTDDRGAFTFEALEAGCWTLVPARGEGAQALAALPERVETTGEGEIAVTVRAFRGLALEGRVLGPDREPVAGVRVEAYADGQWFWGDTRTDENGRFRLGPVTGDTFTLLAYGRDRFANSAPVASRGGDEGIVLRLERAGVLRGRVVDGASGAACAAQVLCTPEVRGFGPFGAGQMLETEADGSFAIGGLAPGRYGLAALSADGRCALASGVSVAAGEGGSELVLALEPGAKLVLHDRGSRPHLFVTVTRAGVPLSFGEALAPGGRATLLAAAGDLVLEVRDDPLDEPRRLSVTLAAGETRELDIGD